MLETERIRDSDYANFHSAEHAAEALCVGCSATIRYGLDTKFVVVVVNCASFGLKVIFAVAGGAADRDCDFHCSIRHDSEFDERLNLSLNPMTLLWSAPDFAVYLYSFLA